MRIAVLGAGAVGGFLGGALARDGHEVSLVVRAGQATEFPAAIHVSSRLLGDISAAVRVQEFLRSPVDVLLVSLKAPDLRAGISAVDPAAMGRALVIPVMNGIDHVLRLRKRFGDHRVVAGSIRVEAERIGPGNYRQLSPFADLRVGPGGPPGATESLAHVLIKAGLTCELVDDEMTLLWAKLAMLAPLALTTSAAGVAIGEIRADAAWSERLLACCQETCAVARAEGANIEAASVRAALWALPPGMRSSMQKDLEASRPLELDAIGGAVMRRGSAHGVSTPTTAELVQRVAARASEIADATAATVRDAAQGSESG